MDDRLKDLRFDLTRSERRFLIIGDSTDEEFRQLCRPSYVGLEEMAAHLERVPLSLFRRPQGLPVIAIHRGHRVNNKAGWGLSLISADPVVLLLGRDVDTQKEVFVAYRPGEGQ